MRREPLLKERRGSANATEWALLMYKGIVWLYLRYRNQGRSRIKDNEQAKQDPLPSPASREKRNTQHEPPPAIHPPTVHSTSFPERSSLASTQ
ncbi:hypothetical protein V5O48_014906 [Marasmius crinis-equi]|uniref:Uncharacterized protein n=1 Tax=Marasmius crinis-equi TaxID=585013 RepID=A0ABR3EW29_9AGAR